MTPEEQAARKDILARIKKARDDLGRFRALIYGPKGSGKTVFCARATKKTLVLDTEESRRSLLNHEDTQDVMVLPVKHFNDLDAIEWAIRDGDIDCDTVVVDTLDKLADDLVTILLDKAVAANPARDRFAASQAEYRVRSELFKRLASSWATLPINLIFTAHSKEVKDESTGKLLIRPSLGDALSDLMGGFVVVQGYLVLEEGDEPGKEKRTLQVHPGKRVDAKSRIGGLPRIISNPSMPALIRAHYDGVKRAKPQEGTTR